MPGKFVFVHVRLGSFIPATEQQLASKKPPQNFPNGLGHGPPRMLCRLSSPASVDSGLARTAGEACWLRIPLQRM